ncbi:YbjN domain-containing protein [Hyphococcus sp. DH-69]|uniref:YbjN domain-containing protein n=1 Tax=Hyphococcus formosus TaxID=3143534 RepID=UPI00398B7478
MSIELIRKPKQSVDPLKVLEAAASGLEFEIERAGANELHVMMPGVWRDIGLWFTWRPELATLQMGAPLELKAPVGRIDEAARLVTMVNERLWLGHFDLWADDNSIVYRNSSLLTPEGNLDNMQGEALIKAASEAIDRFYPAFNFLIWGGKNPDEALQASLFDTAGTA